MTACFQLCTIADLPCVVRGPKAGPAVLIIQPLFEELNRTRRLLAQMAARLAARGVRSWMPDLVGTGDATGQMDWAAWQQNILTIHRNIKSDYTDNIKVISVRGGSLLTNDFPERYLIAPVATGAAILRDLLRTRAAAKPDNPAERVDALAARLKSETLELAGYQVSPELAAALGSATTNSLAARVAHIGDGGFAGPPVWRQAEPVDAGALAADLADDILAWTSTCPSR